AGGSHVVAASIDLAATHCAQVQIWEANGGRPVGDPIELGIIRTSSPSNDVNGWELVAITPDGRYIAATAYMSATPGVWSDERVRVWDLSTRREVACLIPEPGDVRSVALSPDGRRLALSAGRKTQVWDLAGSKRLSRGDDAATVKTLKFSPGGN